MADNTKRPKNWRLIKVREYHSLLGVCLAAFILLVCVSGIYLNHKDFFTSGEPDAKEKPKQAGKSGKALVLTTENPGALPMDLNQALALAKPHLGDAPLERVELKSERGDWSYKIKSQDEAEVIISVATGTITTKAAYQKEGAYDVGKVIKDLHTGKIGGEAGKLFVDFTSIVIIVLTLSGVYLWAVPKVRKRKAQRDAAARAAVGCPASGSPALAPQAT